MSHRSGRRPLENVTLVMLAAVAWICPSLARRSDAEMSVATPVPVRSRDIEVLAKDIEASPALRAAFGEAMDTYVAQWQALRDGELARAHREQAAVKDAREALANAKAVPIQDALCRAIVAAVAADPSSTDTQREAVESWSIRAMRQALLRALVAFEAVTTAPAELAAFPYPPAAALADRSVREAVEHRIKRFERDSIGLLERDLRRACDLGLRAVDDESLDLPSQGQDASRLHGIQAHCVASLKAIADVAALLPADQREAWLRNARRRVILFQLEPDPGTIGIDPETVVKTIPDGAKDAVDARIARWQADRDAAEASVGESATPAELHARMQAVRAVDDAALADLRAIHDDGMMDPELLRRQAIKRHMEARIRAVRADPDGSPGWSASNAAIELANQRAERAAGIDPGGAPEEGIGQRFGGMAGLGVLRRAELESIRSRLGLADVDRSLWDSLASDLMARLGVSSRTAVDAFVELGPDAVDPSDQRTIDVCDAFLVGTSAAESSWFDAVIAAFPGVDRVLVDRERGRRSMLRVIESSGMYLMMPRLAGNRWIDVDLDVAADALPAELLGALEPALAAWRASKTEALVRLRDTVRRGMAELSSQRGGSATSAAARAEQDAAVRVRLARDLDDAARRAESDQQAAAAKVAQALPPPQAALFRRGLGRQEFPEVYREQDLLDAAIDRALSDASLDGEQKVAVAVAWEESRSRFDTIAASLADMIRKSERAVGEWVGAVRIDPGGKGSGTDRVEVQRQTATRRQALEYDASELRARTVRAIRRSIGDDRADAAGVR